MLMQRSYQHTEELSLSQRHLIETRVLKEHAGFINRILRPYFCVFDDGTIEELRQIALMTFLLELRKFDHVVDDDFMKSATLRVRGEVIDELRRRDPMERRKRQLVNQIKKAENILAGRLGRQPTASELCKATDITLEEYHEVVQVIVVDSEVELDAMVAASDNSDHEARLLELQECLETLSEEQQKVMYLLYVQGMNLKETALTLDLNESKVFRIKQASIELLKAKLSQD